MHLRVVADGLEIAGHEWMRVEPVDGITVSEPLGGAPRTLGFADGTRCEVPQGAELDGLLAALGHREQAVVRWQCRWHFAAVALAALVVIVVAGYRWALPWAAEQVAPRLPPALVADLSDQVMQLLDRQALAPSGLVAGRREEIMRSFERLVGSDPALGAPRLLFRRGGAIGANAFALPDGRIVILDELVALAADDGEVMAVLAHELGHAKYRHGLRQLIQSSVVAAVAAGYFGDVSTLLSGFVGLLLESRYSRGFEFEADAYGARLLSVTGGAPQQLAAMLKKLEDSHSPVASAERANWLSSHPDAAARIERLRQP